MVEDSHLEMEYEDRNGSYLHEESEDIYAGTAASDDFAGGGCPECGEELEEPDGCILCGWDSNEESE